MKLKICGMKFAENIGEVSSLEPDYLGFNFYEKSKRYARNELDVQQIKSLNKKICKVGVFVNAEISKIFELVRLYKLDMVQLHGDELPEYCKSVFQCGLNIIKAFGIDERFDFGRLDDYVPYSKYFLFDNKQTSKDAGYGGTGNRFNWEILRKYNCGKDFFLSGGIDLENISEILSLKDKELNIFGIDVNSKFEISPGLKDIEKLKELVKFIK